MSPATAARLQLVDLRLDALDVVEVVVPLVAMAELAYGAAAAFAVVVIISGAHAGGREVAWMVARQFLEWGYGLGVDGNETHRLSREMTFFVARLVARLCVCGLMVV